MKKVISILLIISMVFTSGAFFVLAESVESVVEKVTMASEETKRNTIRYQSIVESEISDETDGSGQVIEASENTETSENNESSAYSEDSTTVFDSENSDESSNTIENKESNDEENTTEIVESETTITNETESSFATKETESIATTKENSTINDGTDIIATTSEIETIIDAEILVSTESDILVVEAVATESDLSIDEIVATESIMTNTLLGASGNSYLWSENLRIALGADKASTLEKIEIVKGGTVESVREKIQIGINEADNSPFYGYYGIDKKFIIPIGENDTIYLPSNCDGFFSFLSNVKKMIGFNYLDVSRVTNMYFMFYGDESLISVDISTWNTPDVENIVAMFGQVYNLTELDFSSFDTHKVVNTSEAYGGMYSMFQNCEKLSRITFGENFIVNDGISGFSTFRGCKSLEVLDLRNFDLSKFSTMDACFADCSSLTTIVVQDHTTLSDSTSKNNMFKGCTNLVGGMNTAFDENVIDGTYAKIDGGTDDPGYFTSVSQYVPAVDWMLTKVASCFADAVITGAVTQVSFASGSEVPEGTPYEIGYNRDDEDIKLNGYQSDDGKSFTIWLPSAKDKLFLDRDVNYLFKGMTGLKEIKNLSILNTTNATSMKGMFYDCTRLSDLDLSSFRTVNVDDMSYMFYGCSDLESIKFSNWDTSSVEDMSYMFSRIEHTADLTKRLKIDLTGFDTSNVKNMSDMFCLSNIEKSLDLSSFDMSNVSNTDRMFAYCYYTKEIIVDDKWNTDNITSSNDMFKNCYSLAGGQGAEVSVYGVTDKSYARIDDKFNDNPGYLTYKGYVINFKCTSDDGATGTMSPIKIPLNESKALPPNTFVCTGKDFVNWYTDDSIVYTYGTEVEDEATLTASKIDNKIILHPKFELPAQKYKIGVLDTAETISAKISDVLIEKGYGTGENGVRFISFKKGELAPSGEQIEVGVASGNDALKLYGYYDTTSRTFTIHTPDSKDKIYLPKDASYMFCGLTELITIDLQYLNTSETTNMEKMFSVQNINYDIMQIRTLDLSNFDVRNVTNMKSMFANNDLLSEITFGNKFVTSKVTDMSGMFSHCRGLNELDLSTFNTSEVTTMEQMFGGCTSLSTLNISSFNTSKVQNMQYMFLGCSGITELNVSHFNTRQVTDMYGMFNGVRVETLDLSNFDTSSVTTMERMFEQSSIKNIIMTNFDTSKVKNMSYMFDAAQNIEELDLRSFDTSEVTNMSCMFNFCTNLKKINVSPNKWSIEKVDSSLWMFDYCYNLEGGSGTKYDSAKTGKEYARIDFGDDQKGYLTAPTYAITYDKNGADGTEIMNKSVVLSGETLPKLKKNVFTKTGYRFDKWIDQDNNEYEDEKENILLTKDLTLKAQWLVNNYTIKFDTKGGTSTAPWENINATYDVSYTIDKNEGNKELTKAGFLFKGWATTSDAVRATINDGATIKNLTSVQNGEVTLYAVWSSEWTITYVGGDGATGEKESGSVKDGENYAIARLTDGEFKKVGYHFKNWLVEGTTTTYADGGTITNVTNNITLIAEWTANNYIIKFNGNGSTSGSMTDTNMIYDEEKALPTNTYKRANYIFKGWATVSDVESPTINDAASIKNLTSELNATVTLYAIWNEEWTISYDSGKGQGTRTAGKVEDGLSYDIARITDGEFKRVGYTFKNWVVDGTTTTYADGDTIENVTNNIKLVADWSPISYTITYNGNGGTLDDESTKVQTLVYGETSALNTYTYAKGSYTFLGWSETEGSNVIKYKDGYSKVGGLNLKTNEGDNVNLYAVWGTMVTFDGNGAKNEMSAQIFYEGVSQNLKANTLVKKGYKFVQWDGDDGESYNDKQSINPTKNIKLVASWSETKKSNTDSDTSGGSKSNSRDAYDGIGISSIKTDADINAIENGRETSIYDINETISKNLDVPFVERNGQWVYDPLTKYWSFIIKENKIHSVGRVSTRIIHTSDEILGETTLSANYSKMADYVGYAMNGWYYIPNETNKNAWYYFDEYGHMSTGYVLTNGSKYYLNTTATDMNYGAMVFGWVSIDGRLYYFDEVGRISSF